MPHLFVWGDHLADSPAWQRFITAPAAYRDAIGKVGGTADWLELPKQGITGNTHMTMMDRNSDQVAGLVQDWMARHGLMQGERR